MTRRLPGSRSPLRVRRRGCPKSGYYDWGAREAAGPTERQIADDPLIELMREVHAASDGNYGVPRMYKELRRAGMVINDKKVRRLMHRAGLIGRHHRRRCRTTFPGPGYETVPDLAGRRFDPGAPDVAWCQDITYIATGEGWLFVASTLDLGSRRLLGYSMADHMRTELVTDALSMALTAPGRCRRRGDRPRGSGHPVSLQRLPRVLPHPSAATIGRKNRNLLGQRRG